ncbi:hypothetical protein AMECASPLE_010847, partial [Ameca splendens]
PHLSQDNEATLSVASLKLDDSSSLLGRDLIFPTMMDRMMGLIKNFKVRVSSAVKNLQDVKDLQGCVATSAELAERWLELHVSACVLKNYPRESASSHFCLRTLP